MSQLEIDFNIFINRIVQMLQNSTKLFEKTIGGDDTKQDLVKQIINYHLAIPQDVADGEGPPHVYVGISRNPYVIDRQSGRDSRDARGAHEVTIEIYAIVVVNEPNFDDSQKLRHTITSIVTEVIGKNKRLLDTGGLNPIARETKYLITPFTDFPSSEKTVQASTVIIRPIVMVSLR